MYALNLDFTGNSLTSGTAQITQNGQMLIGSTALPNIQVGSLLSSHSSMNITYSSPNINLEVKGANTTGIPLVSNGPGNPPIYSSIGVPGGGTGAVTLTGVLIGNGVAAVTGNPVTQFDTLVGGASNAITSVAPGTTNQVLTSNGASSNPSYQTIPSNPPIIFQPNATVMLEDDFMGANNTTTFNSNFSWINSGNQNASTSTIVDNGHPGVIENIALAAGNFWSGLLSNNFASRYQSILLGGGAVVINWVFNIRTLSTGTNRYILDIGLGDTTAASDQANGCYFEYSDNINTGQWDFKTAKASARTTSTSTVAVTTGWHNAQITVNAAASSVAFVMDGVSLGTAIATNIPNTVAVSPFFNMYQSAGTPPANSLSIDLMYMTQVLTVAR